MQPGCQGKSRVTAATFRLFLTATSPRPGLSSSPPPSPAQSQSPSSLEIVTSNLLKLGALTLEDFSVRPPRARAKNFLSNPLYHDVPIAPLVVRDQGTENSKPAPTPAPIFIMDQICSQTFGCVNALNYEIIKEEGKKVSGFFSYRPLPHHHLRFI